MANDNAPGQVVISGRLAALADVEEPLRAAGARRVLRLAGVGRLPLAADGDASPRTWRTRSPTETWRDAGVPVVSNVTAEPLTDADRIRALLAEQVRSPVEWVRSVRTDGSTTASRPSSSAAPAAR